MASETAEGPQKPLTGLGLGSIVHESDTSAHVHSDYVRALVETGVFGFLAFVWLLLSAAVGCAVAMRWARRSGSVPLQAAAVAGSRPRSPASWPAATRT